MKRISISCFLLVLLLFGADPVSALVLNGKEGAFLLAPHVYLLEDKSGLLDIQEVRAEPYASRFVPNPNTDIRLGWATTAWWIRFDVDKQSVGSWYLRINNPAIALAEVFIVDEAGKVTAYGNLRKEFNAQRLPILRLPERNGHYQAYMRTSNLGMARLDVPLELLAEDTYQDRIVQETLFSACIAGGLTILLFYNLILAVSLRSQTYLVLALFLFCLILVLQRINNTFPFLSFVSNPTSVFFSMSYLLTLVTGAHFWRLAIGSARLFPRIDKVLGYVLLVIALFTPFIYLMPHAYVWIHRLALALILVVGAFAIRAFSDNSQPVRGLALAGMVIVVSSIPTVLFGMGALPGVDPSLIHGGLQVGALLSVTLLSLSLAEQTRHLRMQAERVRLEAGTKERFFATLSHELRTPMNSVVAVAELLKAGELPPKEQGYVRRLSVASQHMLDLIDDILDFSRIGQAGITLYKEPFDLEEMLDDLWQIIEVQAESRHLKLQISMSVAEDLKLVGDRQRLSQVLLNLLVNAIKYTEYGTVTLLVRQVQETREDHVCLHFAVVDTGRGISLEDQARLFQPFYRIETSRTGTSVGSGLGLAISAELVRLMGGRLEVNSQTGKGSRFFFSLSLPSCAGPLPISSVADSVSHDGWQDKQILLVDDDELNLLFGQELLGGLGVTVSIAASGAEAIRMLGSGQFDLVFMDVSMPELDGYETTRRIRADSRFTGLPIIALTAHSIQGERERCLAAGMDDYLSKPVYIAGLKQKLLRWLH